VPGYSIIGSSTTSHIAFGSGVYACLGRMFARVQGEAILTAVASVFMDLNLLASRTLRSTTRRGGARASP
jgi:cytochrome P450